MKTRNRPNPRATYTEKHQAIEYRRQRAIRRYATEEEFLKAVTDNSAAIAARAQIEAWEHARLVYTCAAGSLVAYNWSAFSKVLNAAHLAELRPDQLRREVAEAYRKWKAGSRR